MAKKKEKRYVSDNARLMTEWNRERNTDVFPLCLILSSGKKHDGSVAKDTNGKHR